MRSRGPRSRSSLAARSARPLLSLGLLAAGLVLSGAFVGIAIQGSEVDQQKRSILTEIAELERENEEKRLEIQRRQSEDYVIETARDYGYVRPGEGLIAVEGHEPRSATVVDLPGVSFARVMRWWSVFFGPQ